jgi:hypothetical protein
MKMNTAVARAPKLTHEGAVAYQHTNPTQDLQRSVMACLLWEDTFYESGVSIAQRISELVPLVSAESVSKMAIEAREKMKLRHVPLLLACEMAKLKTHRHVVANTVEKIIQRADELSEIFAIYGRERTGTKKLNKLSKQLQKGVARAFRKFNEYQLAKYNRNGAVKLRDALFLCHAKPKDAEQADLWKRLVEGKLAIPDTWEVSLSATKGEGKKEAWERLLAEDKLGALALLRNLRNMKEAGVTETLLRKSLLSMKTERVLPFRFVAAAKYAQNWEPELEQGMYRCLEGQDKLQGKTVIVVDNSGSMDGTKVSARSEMDRSDAACALAILVREVCENVAVIGFGSEAKLLPSRRGFALRDVIKAGPGGGTNTDYALALAQSEGYDRIIVITDEQSHQAIRNPSYNGMPKKGYFINVASNQNGIGYGLWTHIDGWSEAVIDYIRATEAA